MSAEFATTLLLPLGLGLLGFVEPCAIGSTLLFIKLMEGKSAAVKIAQVTTFALSRALFTGLLGASAAVVGDTILDFQRIGWLVMGVAFFAIGALYLTGHIGILMKRIGLGISGTGNLGVSAAVGVLFGLSIPACAAPLLLALLAAAASGTTGGSIALAFLSLALFGLALSLPLVAAVLFPRARRLLDRLAALSRKLPRWTGVLMIALGLWSAWFGLFVDIG